MSRWRWLWLWLVPVLQALGIARAPAALVAVLEAGARYRMRLLVNVARATWGANGDRLTIAKLLEGAGFTAVRVFADAIELPSSEWRSLEAREAAIPRAPAWQAWAEGTWTGARAFAPDMGDVKVMQIDKTLAELVRLAPPDVAAPPPVPRAEPDRAPVVAGFTPAAPSARTRPEVRLTGHLPWEFFEKLRDGCYARGWKPRGLLMVMNSESTIRSTAHNPNGNATGLIQFMPSTLRDMRWVPSAADARGREPWQVLREDYGPIAQLDLVFQYYEGNRPPLVADPDETAFYLATYHPRDNAHAKEAGFVLTRSGTADYAANAGPFDVEHKGWIQVSDLTRRVRAATLDPKTGATSAYWQEASARLQFVEDERGGGGGIAQTMARAGAALGMTVAAAGLAWLGYQAAQHWPATREIARFGT
jgi:hypothetical protein